MKNKCSLSRTRKGVLRKRQLQDREQLPLSRWMYASRPPRVPDDVSRHWRCEAATAEYGVFNARRSWL